MAIFKKSLATMEDLAAGVGQVQQERIGQVVSLGRINMPYCVNTTDELSNLVDPDKFPLAMVGDLRYRWNRGTIHRPDGIPTKFNSLGEWVPDLLSAESIGVWTGSDVKNLQSYLDGITGGAYKIYPDNGVSLGTGADVDISLDYNAIRIGGVVYPVFGLGGVKGKITSVNLVQAPYSMEIAGEIYLLQDITKASPDFIKGDAFWIDCYSFQDYSEVFYDIVALGKPFKFQMPKSSKIILKKYYRIYTDNTVIDLNHAHIKWDGVRLAQPDVPDPNFGGKQMNPENLGRSFIFNFLGTKLATNTVRKTITNPNKSEWRSKVDFHLTHIKTKEQQPTPLSKPHDSDGYSGNMRYPDGEAYFIDIPNMKGSDLNSWANGHRKPSADWTPLGGILDAATHVHFSTGNSNPSESGSNGSGFKRARYAANVEIYKWEWINNFKGVRFWVKDQYPWEINPVDGDTSVTERGALWSLYDNIKSSGIMNAYVENINIYPTVGEGKSKNGIGVAGVTGGHECFIENLHGELIYARMSQVSSSTWCRVDNLSLVDPLSVGGGYGYVSQFASSRDCHASNLRGSRARHIMDFTATGRCSVKNSVSFYEQETAFSLHGQWEYDTLIEGCVGRIGNAISSSASWNFGDCALRTTVRKCRIPTFFNYAQGHETLLEDCIIGTTQTNELDTVFRRCRFLQYARVENKPVRLKDYLLNLLPIEKQCIFDTCYVMPDNAMHAGTNKPKGFQEGTNITMVNSIFDCTHITYINSSGQRVFDDTSTLFDSVRMEGGTLRYGQRNMTWLGTLSCIGTKLDATSFQLSSSATKDGAKLILDDCYQVNSQNYRGIIRNQIDNSLGIKDRDNRNYSLDHFCSVHINGGVYEVQPNPDPTSQHNDPKMCKLFDLARPEASLNISIVGVTVLSGWLICDRRWMPSTAGKVYVDFAYADEKYVQNSLGVFAYAYNFTTNSYSKFPNIRWKSVLEGLFESWEFEPYSDRAQVFTKVIRVNTYSIDASYNFTQKGFPHAGAPKGILKVTFDSNRLGVEVEFTYISTSTHTNISNRTFKRVGYRDNTANDFAWLDWKEM